MHLPGPIAVLLFVGFIVYLFRRDKKVYPEVSSTLWLPTIWMLILGSRQMGQWFALIGLNFAGETNEDGNPIDVITYGILLLAGMYVLGRRRFNWGQVISNNRWLALFFLYCFLSVFWSDFPLSAFKRWVKELGMPVMALIILSEPEPEEAFWAVMRRCAYVLLPISVLFIKYFPQLGRHGQKWGGQDAFTGVTKDKNTLGAVCLIMGVVFVYHWFKVWRMEKSQERKGELYFTGFFLCMVAWLLRMAHSVTSMAVFAVGAMIIYFLSRSWVNKRLVGAYVVGIFVVVVLLDTTFGVSDSVVRLLGKDPGLTGRTEIWHAVLQIDDSPVLGAGFESFWMGSRLAKMESLYWWHPNQAHNGYLETYLDLGLVGLLLLAGLLFATYLKCSRDLLEDAPMAMLRLAFLGASVVYNWTEAGFKGLHPIFFVFVIIALDYPSLQRESIAEVGALEMTDAAPGLVSIPADAGQIEF